ncbi:MAG: aminopeptidase P N-terminal domain-containing protein [Bryobacteraceae bacterium]
MRIVLIALMGLGLQAAPAVPGVRRAELRKALPNAVTVLFGRTEKDSDDFRTGSFQESNFYYLTGWTEPGALLLLDPAREVLFLPRKNRETEKWTGTKAAHDDANVKERTGFEAVMSVELFETELRRSLEKFSGLQAMTGTPEAARLEALAPLRSVSNVRPAVAKLRMKKSPEELALLRRATDITMEGHRAAWKRIAAGLSEYQLAAVMTGVFIDRGCERNAYPPIVGSGPNSVFLHYSANRRRMDRGEVVVMDVGAECSAYASDITRTIPVGGKFSKRQKEIYEIVLAAQKAAIVAVKPGVTIGKTTPNSIYKVAYDYINSHGKDSKGEPLGKYFTHGIGHHVGLDVHDASDTAAPLEAGMVITVEPGIYIPDESIGIRIEDMVLVTEDGAKVLSEALPKEVGEVERALGR